jgi:Tfp pilus assembly protein PilN
MPEKSLVKIIPKPKPKLPGWINFLFWVSVLILVFLIGTFFYLQYQNSLLKEKNNSLQNQINELDVKIKKELKGEVFKISEKIKDFSQILKEHKIISNFFEFLKSISHPRVQFTSLNLNAKNYEVTLRGITENFQVLGEQLLVFKENENIKNLKVFNISLNKEGKVEFSLSFNLTKKIFTPLEN